MDEVVAVRPSVVTLLVSSLISCFVCEDVVIVGGGALELPLVGGGALSVGTGASNVPVDETWAAGGALIGRRDGAASCLTALVASDKLSCFGVSVTCTGGVIISANLSAAAFFVKAAAFLARSSLM